MKTEIAAPRHDQDSIRITDYSVLMQVRAMVLNDLQSRIPADYYSSRAISSNLVINESENLVRINHLARVDFNLAKELIAENDRSQAFTPREVSATDVLSLVGYCLMFLALDETELTPRRLCRMRDAQGKIREALNLYVMYLDVGQARPIAAALATSGAVPVVSSALVDVAVGLQPPTVERRFDEMPHETKRRRWQMCVDAGLIVQDNDYAPLPKGINILAKREGITTQAFSKSVKAHIARGR